MAEKGKRRKIRCGLKGTWAVFEVTTKDHLTLPCSLFLLERILVSMAKLPLKRPQMLVMTKGFFTLMLPNAKVTESQKNRLY